MKHEKYNIKTQYIKTLPFNPSKFEKNPLNPSLFNQRCTLKIKYPQSSQPLVDFFLINILWNFLKTLGNDTFKVYVI
jgi:hypothetical protein